MSARNTKYHTLRISAYTLIEILVSLTIIGILFGFGYVNFRDFSRRQALAGIAKQVQGDLRLVQEMSLSGQKPVDPAEVKPSDPKCLTPNSLNGYNFNIVSTSEYEIRAICTGGNVNASKDVFLPSDISISPAITQDGTPVNPLVFQVLSRGSNVPDTVTIKLTQTAGSTTINSTNVTVTAGGEIK